jgi:hypothetical protein
MRLRLGATFRRVNTWAGAVGVLLGAISIAIGVGMAVWSVRRSEAIALRSGSYQRANVAVGIGDYTFEPNSRTTVLVGSQFEPRESSILPLLLTVANTGDLSAQTMIVDTMSYVAPGVESQLNNKQWITDYRLRQVVQLEQSRQLDGDALHATYALSTMPPGTAMALTIPVTSPQIGAAAPFKSGEYWCVDVLGKDVEVVIRHERQPPHLFRIHPIQCQAEDSLRLPTGVLSVVDRRHAEIRNQLSWSAYLRMLLSGRHELICTELIRKAEQRPELVECTCHTYPLALWRYL